MDSTRDESGRYKKGYDMPDATKSKIAKALRNRPKKNGGYSNIAYGCWKNMLSRTRTKNKSSFYYKMYVADRWLAVNDGFNNFLKDMGPRPSVKHSIDRVDGRSGYYPENCRWATQSEQMLNQVQVRRFTDEARENIRKARLGNKNALGHKLSDESKKKISENLKRYYRSTK